MQNIIKRFENRFPLIKNDRIKEILFLTGMSILVFIEAMKTTLFHENLTFYAIIKTIALLLIALKLALFDRWKVRGFLSCALSLAITLLVRYASGYYTEPFFWILLIWGARDIDFCKILKVHLAVVFLIFGAAFFSSLAGWIPNLQFYSAYGVRNSFGIGYPTDFAAYVFFMTATFCYLTRERTKWWMYALCIILGLVTFKYCKTRLDSSCLVALGLLLMITKMLERVLKGRAEWLKWMLCFSFVALFILVFVLSYNFDPSIEWMRNLDIFFSTRLSLGHSAFESYGLKLFGQYVELHGAGGTTGGVSNYYFLDSSYMYILFQYGIVFTVMVISVFVISSIKRREDIFFLVVLLLIAVNATTAHHLTHIQYNPFFMAALAYFKDSASQLGGKEGNIDAVEKEGEGV